MINNYIDHSGASPPYELAPVTGRDPELLARRHGYENVADLAKQLPRDARIIDIGPGVSEFGAVVASLRPDIVWTNFDLNYRDSRIQEQASGGAPTNLEFVDGDVTRITKIFKEGEFDRAYSYWLFPHLSLGDDAPAETSARGVFYVLKEGGEASIGPLSALHQRFSLPSRNPGLKTTRLIKGEVDEEEFVSEIVENTRLPERIKHRQRLWNELGIVVCGTTHYVDREGIIPKLWDIDTASFVPVPTSRGLQITGKAIVTAVKLALPDKDGFPSR